MQLISHFHFEAFHLNYFFLFLAPEMKYKLIARKFSQQLDLHSHTPKHIMLAQPGMVWDCTRVFFLYSPVKFEKVNISFSGKAVFVCKSNNVCRSRKHFSEASAKCNCCNECNDTKKKKEENSKTRFSFVIQKSASPYSPNSRNSIHNR